MKGEIARLARGSYLYFFGVFLFSCKVAQVLLSPVRFIRLIRAFRVQINRSIRAIRVQKKFLSDSSA